MQPSRRFWLGCMCTCGTTWRPRGGESEMQMGVRALTRCALCIRFVRCTMVTRPSTLRGPVPTWHSSGKAVSGPFLRAAQLAAPLNPLDATALSATNTPRWLRATARIAQYPAIAAPVAAELSAARRAIAIAAATTPAPSKSLTSHPAHGSSESRDSIYHCARLAAYGTVIAGRSLPHSLSRCTALFERCPVGLQMITSARSTVQSS